MTNTNPTTNKQWTKEQMLSFIEQVKVNEPLRDTGALGRQAMRVVASSSNIRKKCASACPGRDASVWLAQGAQL